jgi:hypothetical protein
VAKPTLTGQTKRIARNAQGVLDSASLIPPPSQATIHDFTGLPIDANGWTDFQTMLASGDYVAANVVFVDPVDGNDSDVGIYQIVDLTFDSDGMFQPAVAVKAYKTVAAAYAQMRNGSPDIMLFKRGAEFSSVSFSTSGVGRVRSGASASARFIMASYGSADARPKLLNSYFDLYAKSNVIISGLHWDRPNFLPPNALATGKAYNIAGGASNVLFEDCVFERTARNTIDGAGFNVAMRRNIHTHLAATEGCAYVAENTSVMFEQEVFHEPWREKSTSSVEFRPTSPDLNYGRFMYTSPKSDLDDQGLVIRGNICWRSERGGLNSRSGGLIEDNLFLQTETCPVGGAGGSAGTVQTARIKNNVAMQGTPNSGNGLAFTIKSMVGGELTGNICTDHRGRIGTGNNRISVETAGDYSSTRPGQYFFKNFTIADNVFYGSNVSGAPRMIDLASAFTEIENIVVERNDAQFVNGSSEINRHRLWAGALDGNRFAGFTYRDNRYWSTNNSFTPGTNYAGWVTASGETGSSFAEVSYPDPDRTIDTYLTSIGETGGVDEYIALVMQQSRFNWRAELVANAVNNYIRAGFGKVAV